MRDDSHLTVNMANSGVINITVGDKGVSSTGIQTNNLILNNGLINVVSNGSSGVGIRAIFTLNGGTVVTQGGESALRLGDSITLPDSYTYWTNTIASATGAIKKTYPQDGAFFNSDKYKYIKIEAGT